MGRSIGESKYRFLSYLHGRTLISVVKKRFWFEMGMPMGEFKKVQQFMANNRITSLLIVAAALSLIIFCSFLPNSDDHDDYGQNPRANFGSSLPPHSYHHDNLTPNCSEIIGENSKKTPNCSEITGEGSTNDITISKEVHEGLKDGSISQGFQKVPTDIVNAHQDSSPPLMKEEAATMEKTGESSNSNRTASGELQDGIEGLKDTSISQEFETVVEFVNALQGSSPPLIQLKEEESAMGSDLSKEETRDGLADAEWKRAQIAEFSKCDLYSGKWVYDESYPLYPAGECPYMSADFNCRGNGRQDKEYTKWRWQPSGCDLPRLNATDLLERVRGKRVLFIGDSINRNQWESMLCILSTVVPQNKKSFGRSNDGGTTSFVAQDYNCSFEFFWAPFLVEQGMIKNGNTSKEILKLDAIEKHGAYWRGVDILLFNSAHWWTHGNKVELRDFYMENNYLHSELDPMDAFKRGLTTWANWIDQNIDPVKTKVFFRGFSPMHFSSNQWKNPKGHKCNFEMDPIVEESYVNPYPERMKIVDEVLQKMKFHVALINITTLSDFRKDAHPAIYRLRNGKKLTAEQKKNPDNFGDCSHWCLPGLPDIWNELFYAKLLMLT